MFEVKVKVIYLVAPDLNANRREHIFDLWIKPFPFDDIVKAWAREEIKRIEGEKEFEIFNVQIIAYSEIEEAMK